jgi:hypothetical protein
MDGSFDGVVRQHRTIYLFFTVFVRNFPAYLVWPGAEDAGRDGAGALSPIEVPASAARNLRGARRRAQVPVLIQDKVVRHARDVIADNPVPRLPLRLLTMAGRQFFR